jgi:MFS family permease
MVVLDTTIVTIALPAVQTGPGMSDVDRQWTVMAYTLAVGGLLLLGGRIADRHGRKRTLIVGTLGFAVASVLGGATVLVAARSAQGMFAAVLAPSTMSLLITMFTDGRERAKAFGVFSAVLIVGGALGLILGGVFTEYLSWRWCLYVDVPIALVAVVAASVGSRRRAGCGVRCCTTVAAAACAGQPEPGRCFGECRVELRRDVRDVPAGDLPAADRPPVLTGPGRDRVPAAHAGERAECHADRRAVAAARTPVVLIAPGLLLAAVGMAVLATPETTYLGRILPAEVLVGLGSGAIMSPSIVTATRDVDPADTGVVSALVSTCQQVGAPVGTALLNAVAVSYVDRLGGYRVACLWGAGVLVVAAVLAVVLIRPVASGPRNPAYAGASGGREG